MPKVDVGSVRLFLSCQLTQSNCSSCSWGAYAVLHLNYSPLKTSPLWAIVVILSDVSAPHTVEQSPGKLHVGPPRFGGCDSFISDSLCLV